MSTRRHVDDLFTGALDGDLSPIDEARFHAHLQSCADCSAAFMEFSATVEALHELPKARMAQVVHLPSTPPVAEEPRRRVSFDWFNPGTLLRRFPATAVAGAVAAVLVVIALTRGASAPTTGNPSASAANPAPAAAADTACTQPTSITESSPPAQFAAPQVVTNAGLPGVRLVLAASSLSVTPGQRVSVFAQASVPLATAQPPGATSIPLGSRAVRPCVLVGIGGSGPDFGTSTGTVSGAGSETVPVAIPATDHGPALSNSLPAAPLVTFSVPPGLAPGTVLHIVATIPAGFEGSGSPALTATLTLTTR